MSVSPEYRAELKRLCLRREQMLQIRIAAELAASNWIKDHCSMHSIDALIRFPEYQRLAELARRAQDQAYFAWVDLAAFDENCALT